MGKADPGDLPSEHVYRAFVEDFKGAWTAVEQVCPNGRGNFMFALLAMDFLEWCGQVTKEHPSARTAFIDTLSAADPAACAAKNCSIRSVTRVIGSTNYVSLGGSTSDKHHGTRPASTPEFQ